MSGLISASCSSKASRPPLVFTGGQGGVVFFDAGLHCGGGLLLTVFNALEFSRQRHITRRFLQLMYPRDRGGQVRVVFLRNLLMSSALSKTGSPLLYSSINARIVAVVVKAPSGISGSILNSFPADQAAAPVHAPDFHIQNRERTFWMVLIRGAPRNTSAIPAHL